MVNPNGQWFHVPFGTRFRTPFRVLSGFRGTGFRIALTVLSGVWVTPGLLVPTHPLQVLVHWSFEFSMSFFVVFKYLGHIVLWCRIGWCFVT